MEPLMIAPLEGKFHLRSTLNTDIIYHLVFQSRPLIIMQASTNKLNISDYKRQL